MRPIWFLALLLTAPAFSQRVITTVAGTDWLFPADGLPAKSAPLSGSGGFDVAIDAQGNYYIADSGNNMVFKVTPDGVIHSFAGNGIGIPSGDGGLAVNAGVFLPTGIAVDRAGNVYITEYDSLIRKVDTNGVITSVVGTKEDGFSGDGGPAAQAKINGAFGLAIDAQGVLYIADTYNHRIRKVTPDGIITTIAGTGKAGSVGNNVPALTAQLYYPSRIAVDGQGNVYFTEQLTSDIVATVRKISPTGIITSVAGGGNSLSDNVSATRAALLPIAIASDPAGNLYIADFFTSGIRKVDPRGIIATIAGGNSVSGFSGDGGPAKLGVFRFGYLPAVAVDPAGNIYVADDGNDRIRKITTDGRIDTVAGNGKFRFSGDGGPATSATLDFPTSVVGDAAGNLFITETQSNRIRKIAPDGTISVIAGNSGRDYSGDGGAATQASISLPFYMNLGPNGSLIFGDTANCAVRSISAAGIISTLAGVGTSCDFGGDGGPALSAKLRGPSGAVYDAAGNLIITDSFNNRIRRVKTDGTIETLAGDGTAGFSGDGGPAKLARVNGPGAIRFFNGGIYFADSNNHRIRRIDATTLIITTVAGNGEKGYSGDGGPATAASLNTPQSMTFDAAGNMYIADSRNSVVRLVDLRGVITTFAGSSNASTFGDGGLATDAGLGAIGDLFVSSSGVLYMADQYYHRVRAVLVTPPAFTATPASLSFTAPAGSSAQDLSVNVTGSISGIPFTVASSAPWLTVSPSTARMPAGLKVSVDPSNLTAGSFQGILTITAPTAVPPTRAIAVTLTVTGAGQPSLSVKPNGLTSYAVVNAAKADRSLAVSNLGGGTIAFTATVATNSGGGWLTLSAPGGTVGPFSSTTLLASLNPAGLAAGSYSGTVTIRSTTPAQSVTVPVTMTVTQVEQSILIPQTGLTFYAVEGGGAPPPQLFNILNTGRGQMPYSTRTNTLAGGSWLKASPQDGTVDPTLPVPQVRVDANPSGLRAGVYYGTVQVTAPTAANTPQSVSIILNVLPAGSRLGPIVQPSGMIFTASAGGESPGSQSLVIQSTDATPLTFRVGSTTVNGGNWLTILPPDGTVTPTLPARVVVQPLTQNLGPGVYRGSLTISFSDGSVRVVALALVIPSDSNRAAVRRAGCAPQSLVPLFTQLSPGFSATAGFPGQVAVQVVDDCAQPMTSGDVIVSFSNGDPPLRLTSLNNGTWAGTWTPERVVSPISVVADAAIPAQALKGQVRLTGSIGANDATPVVGAGAVLNGASFALQSALAPGSFVSLFGSKLAAGQNLAPSVPLPTTLGGASVLVAGQEIPLYFANDGQVNAILPYGLPVNTTQQVIVTRGASISVPQTISLAPAAPGVFQFNTAGQGIVIGVDASGAQKLADASGAVRAGQTIVIYCTGLGEVTPSVTAGSPTPLTVLSRTVNTVTVSLGGVDAPVAFAGLTPGSTGLYQINAVVPAGVAPGSAVPLVVTAAGQKSAAVTIAVQ